MVEKTCEITHYFPTHQIHIPNTRPATTIFNRPQGNKKRLLKRKTTAILVGLGKMLYLCGSNR